MKVPLSWLKEYVGITLTPKELAEKLTEVGLGVEKITKTLDDVIFDLEITPNRPDLLSIVGIAREIAAIENPPGGEASKKIKLNVKPIPKPSGKLLFKIHNDFELLEHYSCVIIKNVDIKDSPEWLKKRLNQLGSRPINNIVDITNYVMFELGVPLHAFDYDKIEDHGFFVKKAKGGEKFTSVDGLSYFLPKDAIIIEDSKKLVDLVGIKGGLNSGISKETKSVLLQTSADNPILIRRASQSLGLRSDASAILERGVDKNGMIPALSRAANLILELSGGQIASEVFDIKKPGLDPWKLNLRIDRLNQIIGLVIPEKKILNILESLNLSPKIMKNNIIQTTIPTYRNDLKIEEDLIEEIARIYGYNNFPKTMPIGEMPANQIPYFKDYRLDEKVKNILKASGFSESYTYSLISEKDLVEAGWKTENVLRVDNPVSREFEYLRPTLKINLLKALAQNKANFDKINLFELGKVYLGKNLHEAKEVYFLSGITNTKSFFEVKGILEKTFEDLGIKEDPTKYIESINEGVFFEINYSQILNKINFEKKFNPLPKYPPIMEDLTIVTENNVKTIDIIDEIKSHSFLIVDVSLLDRFENTRTFHIVYQHKDRNLTTDEVSKIRSKILKVLKEKFGVTLKK